MLPPTGGPGKASSGIEMCHPQPAVHLRANSGGCLPPHEPERKSLWPWAAYLPLGADGAGFLLHSGGNLVLLLTQVGVIAMPLCQNHTRVIEWVFLTSFHQHEHPPLSSLRLFHHPHLYKRFHKQHHEWTAPIGVVATYAHPLEHVVGGHFQSLQGSEPGHLAVTNPNICSFSLLQLSNLLPVVIGPVILGSHISTTCMWYCVALISTTISHCGYHLPFLPSPEFHDFHHLRCVHLSIPLINFYFLKYLSAYRETKITHFKFEIYNNCNISWFQVQPVLWCVRRARSSPRHRRQIQAEQTVRAPRAADQPHSSERKHPWYAEEGSLTSEARLTNHWILSLN